MQLQTVTCPLQRLIACPKVTSSYVTSSYWLSELRSQALLGTALERYSGIKPMNKLFSALRNLTVRRYRGLVWRTQLILENSLPVSLDDLGKPCCPQSVRTHTTLTLLTHTDLERQEASFTMEHKARQEVTALRTKLTPVQKAF